MYQQVALNGSAPSGDVIRATVDLYEAEDVWGELIHVCHREVKLEPADGVEPASQRLKDLLVQVIEQL